jgi:RNA polymerase sigma-70 factor (ECF subfamily)
VGVREDLDIAIKRAQEGDGRGFEELFRACAKPVAGYLRSRQVSDPDGTANEVFLRAFRNIRTFRGDSDRFQSWLFTIAHNAAIDDARRRRRRCPEVSMPEDGADTTAGDVQDDVEARFGAARVDELLGSLSDDQREVIVLRVIADLSVEQTAAVVGKSYEAVKALQRRGLVALRHALSESESSGLEGGDLSARSFVRSNESVSSRRVSHQIQARGVSTS